MGILVSQRTIAGLSFAKSYRLYSSNSPISSSSPLPRMFSFSFLVSQHTLLLFSSHMILLQPRTTSLLSSHLSSSRSNLQRIINNTLFMPISMRILPSREVKPSRLMTRGCNGLGQGSTGTQRMQRGVSALGVSGHMRGIPTLRASKHFG